MPNVGHPSRACTACKRRRVKCSETPPNCRACVRLGLSCEWKDVSIFRRQEDWAERLVVRRVKQAKLLRGDPDAAQHLPVPPGPKNPLPNQLTNDMEACALNRFYLEFAYTAGTCPFLYLVAPLYEDASTPACLHKAVRAVSLATTARQLRRHEMMDRAQQYYGNALNSLAVALNDLTIARHDGVLLALCLLSLYETVIYCGTDKSGELNRIHSQGRLAVMRLRGAQQLQSKTGRNLFVLLYHQQLIGSFFDGGHVLQEYPEWIQQISYSTPVASVETLIHEVSTLVTSINRGIHKYQTRAVRELLQKGREMEDRLSTAVHGLPECWPHPEAIAARLTGLGRPADLPKQLEFDVEDLPENMDRYAQVTKALIANIFRATRMRLLQALSLAVTYLVFQSGHDHDPELSALPERFSFVMVQIAECICTDIPLAIGDYEEQCLGTRKVPERKDDDGDPFSHVFLAEDCSYHSCHDRHRIHGRAIRAWTMIFPLESALELTSLSDRQRGRLEGMMEYIKGLVGINLGAGIGMQFT
ncbi:hypothetical protein BU23DRAFT_599657 [Bimuria novae-zelandiae CBS 107.79]|uniref:Zn(2)-C6 fungal-type domain-containing protein n=1 Tax=Bimuria novae-zelandiae CBS 107.79 TaxID=1447943 RepID=A0A6A5V523_9PLEO|nr:hypothetical protein BU23DRAFT_599657 [Bimuria novae-zelandiae CBS 107.79]